MKLSKYGLLSVILMLAACSEEITQPNNTSANTEDDIPNTGIEVYFSAAAEQPMTDAKSAKLLASITPEGNATTRASYTDPYGTQGRSLQVRWDTGDKVSVVQVGEKADGTVLLNANGTLTSYIHNTNPLSETYPTKSNLSVYYDQTEENYTKRLMYWYKDAAKARFFAVYPTIDPNATDGGIKMLYPYLQGGKLDQNKLAKVVVSVPKTQQTVDNKSIGDYKICIPDPRFIYLFGMSSVINASDISNYGSNGFSSTTGQPTATNKPRVALNFKPIMTTLTVGVRGTTGSTATLQELRVYLKDKSGNIIPFPDEVTINYTKFNYTQKTGNLVENKSMENLCEVDESKNVYKDGTTPYIAVKEGQPTSIENGKIAVFTVMLPPLPYDSEHYQLLIRPIYSEDVITGSNGVTLGTATTKIIPSSKIAFLTKPVTKFTLNITDWMGQLKPTTKLKELSIPGAHNAGQVTLEGSGPSWSEPFRQAKQIANITQMLNAGIRAIEIRPNAQATSPANVSYYGRPTSEFYTVDGSSGSRHYILQEVKNWLTAHPTECVIILVNRERTSGSATVGPHAVQNIIDNYGGMDWDGNLTLGQAKGQMVFFLMQDGDENITWGEGKRDDAQFKFKKGIAYMNIHGDNWWEYEKHIGEFKTQNYYGYKAEGSVDGINTAYEKVSTTFAENPYDGTKSFTTYILRHDIGGSLTASDRAQPTFIAKVASDRLGQTVPSKTYASTEAGNNLNEAKEAMTIDFLRMASDFSQSNNWFFTYVPVYSYWQGNRLDADNDPTFNKQRCWAALYPLTHEPILNFVRTYPDKRYGVLFYDFVPGNGYEYFNFKYNPYFGKKDKDAKVDTNNFSNQISLDLTRLLIMSNVKQGFAIGAQ